MDHDRRLHLAELTAAHLPDLHQAVVRSWDDLLPAAAGWALEQRRRAHAAAEAVLHALGCVIAQGDLDEETWTRTRDALYSRGHATPDEAAELLRTVRIVGVEALILRLDEQAQLSAEERWTIQLEAHDLFEQLQRTRAEVDASTVDALLATLEADGQDLA
jgi:hypothetical protein